MTLLDELRKEYTIATLEELERKWAEEPTKSYSTGVPKLDRDTGVGGIPAGRITEIHGPDHCLAWDSFILYNIIDKGGRRQNKKGGTIQHLYERFHKIYGNKRKETKDSDFYVASINEKDCITLNKIMDVVKTGNQNCYEVITERGHKLICTKEHQFYIGNGKYEKLEKLDAGSWVFIHENIPNRKHYKQIRYSELFVKYHPSNRIKSITANDRTGFKKYNYIRYRVKNANIIVEADRNGLTYREYINLLNNGVKEEIDSLWTIPTGFVVHHKDFNSGNDDLSNLELMLDVEHRRLHAILSHNNLRFVVIPDKIKSIKYVGEMETYDIKCLVPYNNYVANKFVVHNSGKTSLALSTVAELHKANADELALYIDAENALDYEYALKFNVDRKRLIVLYPEQGEEVFTVAEKAVRSGEFAIVVVDSVPSVSPRKEMEGEIGDAHVGLVPRLVSQFLRKTAFAVRESGVAVIFTNQMRDRIGRVPLPPDSPGGRALKHHASLRIYLYNVEPIKQGNEILGSKIQYTIKKNKVGPSYGNGVFEIWNDRGICKEAGLLDMAVELGIIQQRGAWFIHNENTIGQGRSSTIKALSEPELYKIILQELKDAERTNHMEHN